MKLRTLSYIAVVAALALSLVACGGGKSTNTNTTTTAQQKAAGAVGSMMNNGAQVPSGAVAPVNINCGAVKPVWVNLSSKAYHEPGDPWYGRTKHGQYMCPSQAAAQGYHPAGQRHKGAMNTENSGYGGGSRHSRHVRGGAMETPSPDYTP